MYTRTHESVLSLCVFCGHKVEDTMAQMMSLRIRPPREVPERGSKRCLSDATVDGQNPA